jgi:hypothetical protein
MAAGMENNILDAVADLFYNNFHSQQTAGKINDRLKTY